jgi:hypothetical protein
MEKPRYKLSAIFGMIVLVTFVLGIAWMAFGGYSGCTTGCTPLSSFGLGSGPAASP